MNCCAASNVPRERPEAGAKGTPGFQLRVVEAGRMALARVEGPLDLEHAPRLLSELGGHGARCCRIVLDLRRAVYIDSAGVRTLLILRDELERCRTELRLVIRPGSAIDRTLRLLQLHESLDLYENAADAWIRSRDSRAPAMAAGRPTGAFEAH